MSDTNGVVIDMDVNVEKPESETHEQDMLNASNELASSTDNVDNFEITPDKPEAVPEKFWKDGQVNQDALVKSYLHLTGKEGLPMDMIKDGAIDNEALLSAYTEAEKGSGESTEEQSTEGKDSKETTDETKETNDTKEPGLDVSEFDFVVDELSESGEVSPETMEKASEQLAKAMNIPSEQATQMMGMYMAGLNSMVGQVDTAVTEAAGGADVEQMFQWAAKNVDAATLDTLEASMNPMSMNLDLTKAIISQISTKYSSIHGIQGKKVEGHTATGGGDNQMFQSEAEIQRAMMDPRYQNDPAYRNSVFRRMPR